MLQFIKLNKSSGNVTELSFASFSKFPMLSLGINRLFLCVGMCNYFLCKIFIPRNFISPSQLPLLVFYLSKHYSHCKHNPTNNWLVCGLGDSDLGSDYSFLWKPEHIYWTVRTFASYLYLLDNNCRFFCVDTLTTKPNPKL